MSQIDREQLKIAGWRQGSVVRLEGILPEDAIPEGATHGIVISQSCDLLNDDLTKEPLVEVLPFIECTVDQLDPMCLHTKSPRHFHCEAKRGLESIGLKLSIHTRAQFDRERLLYETPDTGIQLTEQTIRTLARWVANRYVRSEFPDQFNQLLRHTRLDRRLEALRSFAKELRLALYPDRDLEPGESYDAHLIIVLPHDFDNSNKNYQRAYDALMEAARVSAHLKLEIDARGINDLKLSVAETHKKFELDHLSVRHPDDPQPLPS